MRYTKKELYNMYCIDLTDNEMPLNYKEWEREIYPKDKAFIKTLENKFKAKQWEQYHQSIWECFNASLLGLKRENWLTLTEYERIINMLQQYIDKKAGGKYEEV